MTSVLTHQPNGKIAAVVGEEASASLTYSYDWFGRLKTLAHPVPPTGPAPDLTQCFTYDAADRIKSNSLLAGSGGYDYHEFPTSGRPQHAPLMVNGTALTYDANGNQTKGLRGQVIRFDGENRPLSVILAGTETCYGYGADGSRIARKTYPNSNTGSLPASVCPTELRGLFTGPDAVLFLGPLEIEHPGQTNETIHVFAHPNIRITLATPGSSAWTHTVLHRDAQGSVRAVTAGQDDAGTSGNDRGLKTERRVYRPYGEQIPTFAPAGAPVSKGWIGERFDEEAGLQYLNARYFDPDLAMFIQPDWWEVTEPGVGTNRYGYAGGDPVNGVDPSGHQSIEESFEQAFVLIFSGSATGTMQDATTNANAVATQMVETATNAAETTVKFGVVDYDILSDGEFTWEDPVEILGVIPAGKIAGKAIGAGVTFYKSAGAAENAADIAKIVCSFDGSTLVLTAKGNKLIKDIAPGTDLVWGNDATGAGGWHAVLGQSVAPYDHRVLVTIRDLEGGAEQTITSNRIHPYFVQRPVVEVPPPATEGATYDGPIPGGHWIDAGHLRPGYRLLNPDGTWAEVVSVEERAEPLDAWNLTVKDAHSYFVSGEAGAQPVWVHNNCFEFDRFKYMHDDMSLKQYSNLSNEDIVNSLFNGRDKLLEGKDGLIWKGNARIKILEQRGFDLETIKGQMTYENLYTPSPLGNWWGQ